MPDSLLMWLSGACVLGGGAFVLIGAIGILRLPDFFSRLHAAGLIDTLGTALIALGLIVGAASGPAIVKVLLILGFLLFTAPTATHALAKAAVSSGLDPRKSHDGSS